MKDIQMQTLLTSNERHLIVWYEYVSNMTDPARNVTMQLHDQNAEKLSELPPIHCCLPNELGVYFFEKIYNVRCLCIKFENTLLKTEQEMKTLSGLC